MIYIIIALGYVALTVSLLTYDHIKTKKELEE